MKRAARTYVTSMVRGKMRQRKWDKLQNGNKGTKMLQSHRE